MMLLHARQRVLVYLDCFSERGHILLGPVEPRQSCIHGSTRPKSLSLQHDRASAQLLFQRPAFLEHFCAVQGMSMTRSSVILCAVLRNLQAQPEKQKGSPGWLSSHSQAPPPSQAQCTRPQCGHPLAVCQPAWAPARCCRPRSREAPRRPRPHRPDRPRRRAQG